MKYMRAEFEAWIRKDFSAYSLTRKDGAYLGVVEDMWISWQAALAAVPANHTGDSNEMVQSQQPTYDIEAIKKRMSEIKSHNPAENVQFTELPPAQDDPYMRVFGISSQPAQEPAPTMSQFASKADYLAAIAEPVKQESKTEHVCNYSPSLLDGGGTLVCSCGKWK